MGCLKDFREVGAGRGKKKDQLAERWIATASCGWFREEQGPTGCHTEEVGRGIKGRRGSCSDWSHLCRWEVENRGGGKMGGNRDDCGVR